jgi:hypothetical protein
MAVQNVVLYGDPSRLFDTETYASNQDPESLTATLSDSASLSESRIEDIGQVLADLVSMAEARLLADGIKPLTDASTLSETIAKVLDHAFDAESLTMAETRTIQALKAIPQPPTAMAAPSAYAGVLFGAALYGPNVTDAYSEVVLLLEHVIAFLAEKALTEGITLAETTILAAVMALTENLEIVDGAIGFLPIKGLSEFIRLNDWLEFRWKKAEVWDTTPAYNFRPSSIHNYGPGVYYGFDFYAANPSVNWLLQTADSATWQLATLTVPVLPLYAGTQFGEHLYAADPAARWVRPTGLSRRAWINENGESHN